MKIILIHLSINKQYKTFVMINKFIYKKINQLK